jgi:2-dehydropantoate 2-reductase
MRIAVMGTGGVGGYFGAKLAQGGHDVTFVARGKHLAAMQAEGLRVESGVSPLHLQNVVATDDPKRIAPVDVVMFCVKLWDVEKAAAQVEPLVSGGGVVVPFQNGLAAPEIVQRVVGPARLLGGVAYIAATLREPGVIVHTGTMARLRVGAFPGGPAARAEQFADACRASGIDIEVSSDVRRALWEKFCFLAALSGCTSVARQPVGGIRSDPDLRATFEAAVREAWSVGRAQGVALADDYVAGQLKALDGLPAEMRSSMQNDLAGGRRLEAPWLSGAVAALAKEAGLPAPVSGVLYAALKPYVAGTA